MTNKNIFLTCGLCVYSNVDEKTFKMWCVYDERLNGNSEVVKPYQRACLKFKQRKLR
jgi:hypothetical protein